MGDYLDWCRERGITHAHCPYKCEHPQPFLDDDDILRCNVCYHEQQVLTEMIPCTPETCIDS